MAKSDWNSQDLQEKGLQDENGGKVDAVNILFRQPSVLTQLVESCTYKAKQRE